VRVAPHLDGQVTAQLPIGTPVPIFATVAGDAAAKQDTRWYRISPPARAGRYIYGGYVQPFTARIPERGKSIVVSLHDQWLLAFQNGRLLLDSPVTTGRPELPTPAGAYRVLAKYAPYRMISPWPASSPFYYPATTVRYALQFRTDGYFIHDAGWRSAFGPGTNLPHRDPGDPFGSHGCVNVPTPVERNLFRWADVGTMIRIVY
jgi:lipoprotein-anchoring transpeptidase ErfK/SrfK